MRMKRRERIADREADRCAEELLQGETCSQAFGRGLSCRRLYGMGFKCCQRCDPCGHDGTLCSSAVSKPVSSESWVSPRCSCDQVVVTGACNYKGCAKPDALGVFSRRRGRRTADGRFVYVKDREQPGPGQGVPADAHFHQAYDDSSGAHRSQDVGVFLYFLREPGSEPGRWVVGPRAQLDDDVFARSAPTDASARRPAN